LNRSLKDGLKYTRTT